MSVATWKVDGIDTKEGLMRCDNMEALYYTVAKSFYLSGEVKYEELLESAEAQDYDKYLILVHGLKNAALSIGATELSRMSAEHEKAARSKDYEFIRNSWKTESSLYKKVLDGLHEQLLKEGILKEVIEDSEKQDISCEEFEVTVLKIINASEVCDQNEMLEQIKKLRYSRLSEELSKAVYGIEKLIEIFEFDRATEWLKKLKYSV